MSWAADNIKFVAFPVAGTGFDAPTLWIRLGNSPDAFFKLPQPLGGTHALGRLGDWKGSLIAQSSRYELTLSGLEADGEPQDIQDLDRAFEEGCKFFLKLLGSDSFVRLSVITSVVQTFATLEEAAQFFEKNLPVKSVPSNAQDLIFQVNVVAPGRVRPNISINRVCRWSQQARQVLEVSFVSGTPHQSVTSEEIVVIGTFDINTAPQSEPFDGDHVTPIIDDLLTNTKQLIERGYDALS